MILNENVIKGKWLEIRGDLQKTWGKLTNDELDKTKGDFKSITGLLQQRYGQTQDSYNKKLTDIFESFQTEKNKSVEQIKKTIKK